MSTVHHPVMTARAGAWQVAPDLFCLGPNGRTQTDVYFVVSGSSWTLVDAGWAHDAATIERAAAALFGTGVGPAAIVLTHVHPDHAGAARELARTWDRPVYVHPYELPIANGDLAAMTAAAGPLDTWLVLPMLRAIGRRRRDAILGGGSLEGVVRAFDPSGAVPGLREWASVPTPGHAPGHLSFFRPSDRVLITGDAVVTLKVNALSGLVLQRQGLSGPPRYTSWDWGAAKASIATLARLQPDVLAGGHGMPLTGPGTAGALRALAVRSAG